MAEKFEISFITILPKIEKDEFGFPETGRTRCIGFFKTIEKAIQSVKEGGPEFYNIFGGQYILIETYEEGILKIALKRILFEWNGTEYVQIEEPEILKNVCNYAIN